jgi:hypothetical protein
MADANQWWGNPLTTNQYTGQPDYLASLSPTIAPLGNNVPALGESGAGGGGFSDWFNNSGILGSKLTDGTQVQGWGMPALNVASGLTNAYFGLQQYNLAKDTLNQNKKQFQLNFDAQRKTTNASLADRQNARVASNPGAYQSVSDYMGKYGI